MQTEVRRGLSRLGVGVALLVAIVAGALGVAGVTGRTAKAGADNAAALPAIGVQFHAVWGDYSTAERLEVLDKLAAAHVQWVRIDLGWLNIEDNGPGSRNAWYLSMVDGIMAAAHARNINVLATLWLTPDWANGGAGRTTPPSDPQTYANFAGWMANRYRGEVQAWEIWNEPNEESFFANADPVRYAGLVRAAYPAIKAGNPDATVVAGSVALNDTDWLGRMYAAGAQGSFDALSTHPYQAPADGAPERADDGNAWTLGHLAGVHDLMVRNGDGNKPIWATEFGWSSHANTGSEPGWQKGVSEQLQAEYLVRAYRFMGSQFPYVTHAFWYEERNESDGTPQGMNYGLLNHDLSEKPAYAAMKSLSETTIPVAIPPVSPTTAPPATVPVPTTAPAPAPRPVVPPAAPAPAPAPAAPAAGPGSYRLFDTNGAVYHFGAAAGLAGAPFHDVAAAVGTRSGEGAWLINRSGNVFATGDAPMLGSLAGLPLNKPIVGSAPSANGYWLVASDGGIFTFGDARFAGSTGNIHLNQPIVGMASTPSGNGYWLVASDGGIFTFGDSTFHGSTGNIKLNQPIFGMAATATGSGYWLVAKDGGVFCFGDAPFSGSAGSVPGASVVSVQRAA